MKDGATGWRKAHGMHFALHILAGDRPSGACDNKAGSAAIHKFLIGLPRFRTIRRNKPRVNWIALRLYIKDTRISAPHISLKSRFCVTVALIYTRAMAMSGKGMGHLCI